MSTDENGLSRTLSLEVIIPPSDTWDSLYLSSNPSSSSNLSELTKATTMGSIGERKGGEMQYFRRAQTEFKPPLTANENAYLGDVATTGLFSPMTSGFFRLEKGTPLEYTYHYEEMKIILEGHFYIKDETTGRQCTAQKGDVFHFPKGAKITFRTDDYGLAFYVGQRQKGAA